jgi:hypothetical protein
MSEERAVKHHILPRSYLERFSQGEQIWVLDFELKRQYQVNIRDAATIKDFYTAKTISKDEDDVIEQEFLGKIESLAGPAIDHIIEKRTFKDRPEWDILINFCALMCVRTPAFRQIVLEICEHIANTMTESMLKDEATFNHTMKKVEDKVKTSLPLTYEQAVEVQKHSEITMDVPRTYYIRLMMEYAAKLVSIFGNMTLNLLCIPYECEAKFVTGDVPIIPISRKNDSSKMWIADTNCDLYFPLSSRCCLVLNYDGLSKVNDVNRKGIAFVNHLMACNCTRIVLSENQSFIWTQENGIISNDQLLLINSWGPEKKVNLRARIPGVNISSSCHNDWNLLTSDDED